MLIEFNNVTKVYGRNKKAVDDISFQLSGTGVIAILGPNGSGKSTIMKLMSNIINPTKGEILIDGKNLTKNREKALEKITAMVDDPMPYIDLTIEDFFNFMLKIRNGSRDEIESLSNILEIPDQKRRLSELSKGNLQKVMILSTFIGNPETIILDEPFNSLDPKIHFKLIDIIKEKSKDKLFIISSHSIYDASIISSKTLFINAGKVVYLGSTKELLMKSGTRKLRVEFISKISETEISKPFIEVKKVSDTQYELSFKPDNEEEAIKILNSLGLKSIMEAETTLESLYENLRGESK